MTSEAEVTFDMPTRQSRQVGESGDGGVSANNGLYGNLGGGDSLLNRLPPVVAKYFWYLVLLWIIINALAMLIIFSIAVAALRQNNDLEDEVADVVNGEVHFLQKLDRRLRRLERPHADCGDTMINSAHNMCIHVSRVKMTYAEAADACEALNNSHLAFPRDALEMAVLKSMAPFDPDQNNSVTFLGLSRTSDVLNDWQFHDSTTYNISQKLDEFWDIGEPNPAGNCAAFIVGSAHHNKVVTQDCSTPGYFICGKHHQANENN
ncbi:uncharacterized protein LOC142336876 [Convolutriloba macropyga]|uniref:uncharacterized protein LOC142336876 n=1 Tax=Convolutriloba macropyga TaxID=536237 RepID=UPI003F527B00